MPTPQPAKPRVKKIVARLGVRQVTTQWTDGTETHKKITRGDGKNELTVTLDDSRQFPACAFGSEEIHWTAAEMKKLMDTLRDNLCIRPVGGD